MASEKNASNWPGHLRHREAQATSPLANGGGTPTYSAVCLVAAIYDSLFLFTDGASEVRDASGAEYGVDRLAKLVGSQRTLAPEALAGACLKELRDFSLGAPKADDLTLLVLRREK